MRPYSPVGGTSLCQVNFTSEEVADRNGLRDGGKEGFEGLLCRGEGDASGAVGLEDATLGAVADKRDYAFDAELGGLFDGPLEAVGVFGRTDAKCESVGKCAPSLLGRVDPEDCLARVGVYQCAVEKGAGPVDAIDRVSLPVPQYFDAVPGFLAVQTDGPGVDFRCKKQFHTAKKR